ncbi:MAG: tetratricopeptide repeat protein [Elusimicrobia bacterium]|nr:tetratricopeptide repeat protein [Elusimicrobiota bacterium]
MARPGFWEELFQKTRKGRDMDWEGRARAALADPEAGLAALLDWVGAHIEDETRRVFFWELLKLADREKAARAIETRLYAPGLPDQLRRLLAASLALVGGRVNPDRLADLMETPLGHEPPARFLRDILDQPDPADAVAMFLKTFERVFPDMRSAALGELAALGDHPELPRLLVPLLYNHHALLSRPALDLLARSPHIIALRALTGLYAALPEGHLLRRDLQTGLETLAVRERAGVLKPPPICRDRINRCFLVAPDGVGTSCAIISKLRPDGEIAFLDFVANERLGVKQAFGGIIAPRKFENILRDMGPSEGWIMAEVPAARVLELARRAERDTFAAGRDFPPEYLAWKWELALAQESSEEKLSRRQAEFAALAAKAPRWAPAFPDVFALFASLGMGTWGFEGEAGDAARRLGERWMKDDPKRLKTDPESLPSRELIAQGIPDADLPLWKQRLLDYALVHWMRAEERTARLALWASETLTSANRLDHPFSRGVALRSMGLLPKPIKEPGGGGGGPGRSNPCPCGSGRKFKKCCGKGGQTFAAPVSDIERRVRDEMGAFALCLPRAELERAWRSFEEGPETLDSAMRGDPQRMSIFLDWLLLGCEMGGKSALERFEIARGFLLNEAEAACLARIKTCRLGVFEVHDVRPGEGVTLQDLFNAEMLEARDISASRQLVRWDLLAAWILHEEAGAFGEPAAPAADGARRKPRSPLWGVALPFEAESREELKTLLEDAFRKLKAVQPLAEWQRFLNASVPLLRRLQRDIIERRRRALENPITPEGDPVRFCKAAYSVSDFRRALAVLRGLAKLEEGDSRLGPDDRLEEIEFDWLVPLKTLQRKGPAEGFVMYSQRVGPDGAADNRVGYAHFKLSKECLDIETLSKERLAAAAKLMEDSCAGLLGLLSQDERSIQESRESADRSQAADEGDPSHPVLTAAAARRQVRKWLRTPVPFLGTLKPVDAAREPQGRQRLGDLLKDYENRELRAQGRGPSIFGTAQILALRELLNLPVPDYLQSAERLYRDLLEKAKQGGDEEEDPEDRDYRQAMHLHKQGRLREAAAAYERLKERFRGHPMKFRLWGNLGVCYIALGELEKSIHCLETALEVRPDYALARNNLSMARALLKQPPEKRDPKRLA